MKVEIIRGVKAGKMAFPDEIRGIKMSPENEIDIENLRLLYEDSWGANEEGILYEIQDDSDLLAKEITSIFFKRQLA